MVSLKRALRYLRYDRMQFLDSLVKNINFLFNDKTYLSLRYRFQMGYWIDWNNPKTFTEKIQWLKVYGFKPEYTKLVDKYRVKDYVASLIGHKYIIPTLSVWNTVQDIDWENLPNQFVLKTTHGGGSQGVVICSDKKYFDKVKAAKKLSESMNTSAGQTFREHPYQNVEKKIIAERYMSDNNDGSVEGELSDYKFFCFNSEPKFCQVIRDRHTKETIDFYDMDWNHMPFVGLNPVARNGLTPVARPENLDEMIDICRKLSKDIPFVRIDLYLIQNNIYFGEITLYPASGFGVFYPKEWNEKLGNLIVLK